MPKYRVWESFRGSVAFEVWADTEKEAVQKVMDGAEGVKEVYDNSRDYEYESEGIIEE